MIGQLFQDLTTGKWQNTAFKPGKLGLRAQVPNHSAPQPLTSMDGAPSPFFFFSMKAILSRNMTTLHIVFSVTRFS